MATKKNEITLEIKNIEQAVVTVRIKGTTPLIMHAWSTKAKTMMLEKQMKTAKKGAREAKNPVEDFIESAYWLTKKPEEFTEEAFEKAVSEGARWGFPATAFKQSIISAAYRNEMVKNMAELRGAFFIEGEGPEQLVEIKGCVPHIREDMCRVGMGTADIRFRAQFDQWYADLRIKYNANGKFSFEQIASLINVGGFCCGVGEWRPERDGIYGMYEVATA